MAPLPPQPKVLTNEEIDALLTQLRNESIDVRLSALNTLAPIQVPSDAFDVADCLLLLLQSNAVPEVRKKAVGILGIRFASTPKYAKALFVALGDVSEEVRDLVGSYYFYLPRDQMYVSEYLAAVRHSNASMRSNFIHHLRYGPFDTAITQEIIAALSDQDVRNRNQAIGVLALIVKQSKEQAIRAKPALIGALKAPQPAIAFTAAKALRELEATNAAVDQVFDDTIRSYLFFKDENTRREALWELGSSPKDGEKYLERIIELLDGSDGDLYNAVLALKKLGTRAQPAIPHLKQVLFRNTCVREIAEALAAIGTQDQEIMDWLARQLLVNDPCVVASALSAAEGLAYFGKQGVPYLIKGLEWDNGWVQHCCIVLLGNVGKAADTAIPHLLQLLENGGGQPSADFYGAEERSDAMDLLVRLAPEDERVVSRIRAIAQDPNDIRCGAAVKSLELIEASAPAIDTATTEPTNILQLIPHNLQWLENGGGRPTAAFQGAKACYGHEERSNLMDSLLKIAPEDERIVNRIVAIAQDANDIRRGVAMKSLAMIGRIQWPC